MPDIDNARVLPEVTMTDELAAAIQAAVSSTDVKALLVAAAEQELATKTAHDQAQADATKAATDKAAAEAAAAEAAAKANKIFTRTEIIGGKEFPFEASTEAELDRLVLNAFKVAYNVRQPEEKPVAAPDAAAVAAAAEAEVAAKTELERKFRLGEISVADYIQQSGAVNDYLSKQGLSVETLKTVVEKNKAETEHQSWASASETFRNSDIGADWPGGEKNRILLGDKLAALGLTDATDKVAALAQAWVAMKSAGSYFPQGDEPVPVKATGDAAAIAAKAAADAAAAKAAADAAAAKSASDAAAAAEATRVAAATRVRALSSSLFGASSGTSGAPIVNPSVVEAKKVIPDNASPAEIVAAWTNETLKQGIDPNAAFVATHRAKAI